MSDTKIISDFVTRIMGRPSLATTKSDDESSALIVRDPQLIQRLHELRLANLSEVNHIPKDSAWLLRELFQERLTEDELSTILKNKPKPQQIIDLVKLILEAPLENSSKENNTASLQKIQSLLGLQDIELTKKILSSRYTVSEDTVEDAFAKALVHNGKFYISPKTYFFLNLRAFGGSCKDTISKKEAQELLESIRADLVNAGFDKKLLNSFVKTFGDEKAKDLITYSLVQEFIRYNPGLFKANPYADTCLAGFIDYRRNDDETRKDILSFIRNYIQSNYPKTDPIKIVNDTNSFYDRPGIIHLGSGNSGVSRGSTDETTELQPSSNPSHSEEEALTNVTENSADACAEDLEFDLAPSEEADPRLAPTVAASDQTSKESTKREVIIRPPKEPIEPILGIIDESLNIVKQDPARFVGRSETELLSALEVLHQQKIEDNDQKLALLRILEAVLIIKKNFDTYLLEMKRQLPLATIGDLGIIQKRVKERRKKHDEIVHLANIFYDVVKQVAIEGKNILEILRELKDMQGIKDHYAGTSFQETTDYHRKIDHIVTKTLDSYDGDLKDLEKGKLLSTFSPRKSKAFTTILFENIVDHFFKGNPQKSAEIKELARPIIDPYYIKGLKRRMFLQGAVASIVTSGALATAGKVYYDASQPKFSDNKSFTLKELYQAHQALNKDSSLSSNRLKLMTAILAQLNNITIDKNLHFDINEAVIIPAPVSLEGKGYKHYKTDDEVRYYRDSSNFVTDIEEGLGERTELSRTKAEEFADEFFLLRRSYYSGIRQNVPEFITPIITTDADKKPKLVLIVDTELLDRLVKNPGDEELATRIAKGMSFVDFSTRLSYQRLLDKARKQEPDLHSKPAPNTPIIVSNNIYQGIEKHPNLKKLAETISSLSRSKNISLNKDNQVIQLKLNSDN
jgi:hypothetical protein